MAKSKPIEGTVVITDKQTKGKGQFGNQWISENFKNLTFSIILKPTFLHASEQFYISKIISLACLDVFLDFNCKGFAIKWPNDIFYKNKKIGGILIENTIYTTQINDSIIGVGLNINQENFQDLNLATSLKNIIQKEVDLENLLHNILKKMDVFYLMLRNKKHSIIDSLYEKHLLGFATRRQFINLKTNQKFQAEIMGVNKIGQLHLKNTKGSIFYNFKEVEWVF